MALLVIPHFSLAPKLLSSPIKLDQGENKYLLKIRNNFVVLFKISNIFNLLVRLNMSKDIKINYVLCNEISHEI